MIHLSVIPFHVLQFWGNTKKGKSQVVTFSDGVKLSIPGYSKFSRDTLKKGLVFHITECTNPAQSWIEFRDSYGIRHVLRLDNFLIYDPNKLISNYNFYNKVNSPNE